MLDDLIRSLPKSLLAFLALVVGLIFMMINDPPKNPCESQLEIFREAQKNFLFLQTKNEISRPADIDSFVENCRNANEPGGCQELFAGLLEMTKDLRAIPMSCDGEVGKLPEVQSSLIGSLKLMVRLAWGDQPPIGYTMKNGWLNSPDVALYCGLKERTIAIYGQEQFSEIQENLMKELPLANTMTRDQIWERTILSDRCDAYR